jgi:hypothetical protein
LGVPDAAPGRYVDLADPDKQLTWTASERVPPRSRRHRIQNNLLGTVDYCPLVRKTSLLQDYQTQGYGEQARKLTMEADPVLFQRAADYLYLSETKSSYAIEGETPSPDRAERFVAALAQAGQADISSEAALAALQRQIVQDPRFAASGWRREQNYVGRTRIDFSEEVSYPCPKTLDLADLMAAWLGMVKKIHAAGATDPVILAACASFGFVYLHPFEDGNGRLHRFLIHHVLAQRSYTPPGVIFPVSAVMYRRRRDYEAVLETVSRLVKPYVRYELDQQNRMTVTNDTVDLYRYPDLTPHAEFLYECIAETLEKDWPQELSFLKAFDGAFRTVQGIVDMPDAKIRLMVRLLLQNHGRLAEGKRNLFQVLSDAEIQAIEQGVLPFVEPENRT